MMAGTGWCSWLISASSQSPVAVLPFSAMEQQQRQLSQGTQGGAMLMAPAKGPDSGHVANHIPARTGGHLTK